MHLSSLTDPDITLVVDTSVLINLHACAHGERIMSAVPNLFVVPDIVAGELNSETGVAKGQPTFLQNLVDRGKVQVVEMSDAEYETFLSLTSVSPTLGDGEAAAIAIAKSRNTHPVIDDGKGRTRASELVSKRVPAWSLDLILHPAVISAISDTDANDALYLALRLGRMRIPTKSLDSVISRIGRERASQCTCLPGYKDLFLSSPKSACPGC